MLDLTLYPEFRSDIQGSVTNIHPVVVIKSNPEIYLSYNEETLSVNGTQTHSINELLEVFDWDRVFDGIPTNSFHGDFHFYNIVYDGSENFYLLDWRQNFGGSDVGDVYYDLAKMYGGILMS